MKTKQQSRGYRNNYPLNIIKTAGTLWLMLKTAT